MTMPLGRTKVMDEDFAFLLKYLRLFKKITLRKVEKYFEDLRYNEDLTFERYFNGRKFGVGDKIVSEDLRNDLRLCVSLNIMKLIPEPPYMYGVNKNMINEILSFHGYL